MERKVENNAFDYYRLQSIVSHLVTVYLYTFEPTLLDGIEPPIACSSGSSVLLLRHFGPLYLSPDSIRTLEMI